MARIDKYDPHVGGFRARLAADWLIGDIGAIIGVSLDANGRIVKGAGSQGIVGICVLQNFNRTKAGDQVDVMTDGELVEVTGLTGQGPGKKMYMTAAGVISATVLGAGLNGYKLGQMVETDRLVVRFQEVQG
jgi:hypothetical protein